MYPRKMFTLFFQKNACPYKSINSKRIAELRNLLYNDIIKGDDFYGRKRRKNIFP